MTTIENETGWTKQVAGILRIESAHHRAYFRLLDDWAKLYLDGIRIRERMRKKQAQVEWGFDLTTYLDKKIPRWLRAEIAIANMLIRMYFEGIGRDSSECIHEFVDSDGGFKGICKKCGELSADTV